MYNRPSTANPGQANFIAPLFLSSPTHPGDYRIWHPFHFQDISSMTFCSLSFSSFSDDLFLLLFTLFAHTFFLDLFSLVVCSFISAFPELLSRTSTFYPWPISMNINTEPSSCSLKRIRHV